MAEAGTRTESAPPDPGRPRPRSLVANSSAVFAVSLVIQLISYIPTYFLARGLGLSVAGQTLFGTIQTFLLLATTVTYLAELRIGSAYTFFVSRGESAREVTATYLIIRMAMVGTGGIVLWFLAPTVHVASMATLPIFGVWMALPLLWSMSTVYQNFWVSQGDSARGQYAQLAEAIVRAAVLTYVALVPLNTVGHGTATPISTLWAMTYAYAVGAGAGAVIALPTLLANRGPFRTATVSKYVRWSWPLMGSLMLLYLSGNLISYIVVGLLNAHEFNIYNAANAFRILALALPAAIAVPLFPHISGLHKGEAFQLIRSRTWQTLRFTAILVVPGVLALTVYRANILNTFYSGSYLNGSTALGILAISAIPAALSQIIATTMTSIGRTRLELYISSVQVACLVGVSALLVRPTGIFEGVSDWGGFPGNPTAHGIVSIFPSGFPNLSAYTVTGINGAALAVLVASLAAFALNSYFLYSLLGVRLQARSILTILLSSAASFFAISRLNVLLPVNRYYQLAAGIVLGFAVYLLVLAAVGELSKEDLIVVGRSAGLPEGFARIFGRFCWRATTPPVNDLPPRGAAGLVPIEADWARGPPPPRPPPKP